MKISQPIIYFPAVIDFKAHQAYFPHVKVEDYLGDKRMIMVQFIEGSSVKKIIKMLSNRLAKLIAISMFNHNLPEPKSDFDLESIELTSSQKTILVPVDVKRTVHKLLGKPIRKTVTIPYILDSIAQKHCWNFSALLRDAIQKKIKNLNREE